MRSTLTLCVILWVSTGLGGSFGPAVVGQTAPSAAESNTAAQRATAHTAAAADLLDEGFAKPTAEARLRAYWWWLNGNVTKASITRDLEEMAAKGFGGALICDAGGANQDGNDRVPHGPDFFSDAWRELYKHALREADRLGLEMSLNIQSGWNLGGPMVPAEDAPKKLVWSRKHIPGSANVEVKLDEPKHPPAFYKDLFVVASPVRTNTALQPARRPIQDLDKKALVKPLSFSAPDTSLLLVDVPPQEGEQDTHAREIFDLTGKMDVDGTLRWDAPAGDWQVLRIGCTLNDHCRVSTCSDGWQGYAIDPFDAGSFERYWNQVVEPLIADAGPLAGRALKYLHTDSWEVEVANWTPTLREEFRNRRGYDLLAYLPVVAGFIVDSREVSNRFLNDLRRTMGDLAVDNHYRLFADWAHRRNLLIHPESGGPHAVPVDAQRCLGMNDAPMSEFWARSWRHRVGDPNRFFVKQPASAAHTYGRRLVLAEGFTTIGPHWQETLWDNLKPSFDKAACEGLNRLVWHAFICSPAEMGMPGQEYFAGTHFNPNATWWSRSAPFLAYINRCQHMLQQGLFVADACYYYGDHVPNFAQLKSSDPARVLPGYDYDVVTEEVILNRMSVVNAASLSQNSCGTGLQPVDSRPASEDFRLRLPDGMNYRAIVLADRPNISPAVLSKLKQLVEAGATIIGPKPERATGLSGYPECDARIRQIADELWGDVDGKRITEHRFGKGRVIFGKTAREVLSADGVAADFEYEAAAAEPALNYIHRRDGDTDIYFVASNTDVDQRIACTFRITGKQPELWDPITGRIRDAAVWSRSDGRTTVPLEFAPYGSLFVVFRKPAQPQPEMIAPQAAARSNFTKFTKLQDVPGPWTVRFDPKWGGPEAVEFGRVGELDDAR
jgi:hypothetical protein